MRLDAIPPFRQLEPPPPSSLPLFRGGFTAGLSGLGGTGVEGNVDNTMHYCT